MNPSRYIFNCLVIAILCYPHLFLRADEPNSIPIKINIGLGLGAYSLHDVSDLGSQRIYGSQLSIQAVVERSVIQKHKNRIPKKYRKAAGYLDEVSVGFLYIPKTLYISPENDGIQAYGATWGFVPKLQIGISFFSLGVQGGLIATYIYYDDEAFDEPVHFIRPGLRGGINLSIPLFSKNLILEAGLNQDIYLPQKFHNDKSMWRISGQYLTIHFRFPTTIRM